MTDQELDALLNRVDVQGTNLMTACARALRELRAENERLRLLVEDAFTHGVVEGRAAQ